MKKILLSVLIVVLITCTLFSTSFAYGTQVMDFDSAYKTWLFLEEPGIPVWVGTTCVSNLFQNYMIAGQYIGFHECSTFAYQIEWVYPYDQYTNAGSTRYYYKGSTGIGSTYMPYDGNVWYDPDWIWDYHTGNTDGDVLGVGYDTYYAKSTSTYVCPEAVYPTATINNSVSMTVSQ